MFRDAAADVAAAASMLLLAWLVPGLRPLARLLVHPTALAANLVAAATCCLGWAAAAHVSEVVLTERVNFLRAGPQQAEARAAAVAAHCRDAAADPLSRSLALWDLCLSAEEVGPQAWRRGRVPTVLPPAACGISELAAASCRALFDSVSPAGWAAVAGACLEEIDGLTRAVSDAMPSIREERSKAAAEQAKKGDSKALAALSQLPAPEVCAALALQRVESRWQQIGWSVRALAALAAASRAEDRYGHLQLGEPRLAAVLASLAAARAAVEWLATEGPGKRRVWPAGWVSGPASPLDMASPCTGRPDRRPKRACCPGPCGRCPTGPVLRSGSSQHGQRAGRTGRRSRGSAPCGTRSVPPSTG